MKQIDPETLEAYLAGTLPPEETAELDNRLDTDPDFKLAVDSYVSASLHACNVDIRSKKASKTRIITWSSVAAAACIIIAIGAYMITGNTGNDIPSEPIYRGTDTVFEVTNDTIINDSIQ